MRYWVGAALGHLQCFPYPYLSKSEARLYIFEAVFNLP